MEAQLKKVNSFFDLPSIDKIKEYANKALLCCPDKMQNILFDTKISVENFADKDVLKELNVINKNELLGLYKMQRKDKGRELVLYRCPLILYSKVTDEEISSVVARVTVYEISHRANCASLKRQWLEKIKKL